VRQLSQYQIWPYEAQMGDHTIDGEIFKFYATTPGNDSSKALIVSPNDLYSDDYMQASITPMPWDVHCTTH
jgi:hypothetical protein